MLIICYTLQAIFAQPRMYYLSKTDPYSCRQAFGLPSAHCFQEFSLFLYCVIDYARFCNEIDQTQIIDDTMEEVIVKKKFWTWKSGLIITSVGSLVCASAVLRIFTYINTVNQAVSGVAFGIWLACLFGFVLREPIFKHVEALIDDYYDMKWYGRLREIAALTFVSMTAVPLICKISDGSAFYTKGQNSDPTDTNNDTDCGDKIMSNVTYFDRLTA
jgi:hypothetical protein